MQNTKSKTIFVWSTPRSISTAFERCFKDRLDFSVVHEPFTECYYYGPDRRSSRYGATATQVQYTREEALGRIATHREDRHVLVKELCFQAHVYVDQDTLSGWSNAFLLRHPYSVARSLVKLKPDFTDDEFGFSAMRHVLKMLGYIPPVIEGDLFCSHTTQSLKRFCSALGVPYLDGYESWNSGAVRDWTPEEYAAHTRWHSRLHDSKGIEPPAERPSRTEVSGLGLSAEQMKTVDAAVELFDELSPYAL